MHDDAKQWIDALRLERHPEGGWFREVYRATEAIAHEALPSRFTGERSFSTAIYFLLESAEFSALHRIRQDELWHFYDGAPLTVHMLDSVGGYSIAKLGKDFQAGQQPMAMAPAGCLFGSTVEDEESFALVGCTVAPGFDFDDFEMPSRKKLLKKYPHHREIVERLTR